AGGRGTTRSGAAARRPPRPSAAAELQQRYPPNRTFPALPRPPGRGGAVFSAHTTRSPRANGKRDADFPPRPAGRAGAVRFGYLGFSRRRGDQSAPPGLPVGRGPAPGELASGTELSGARQLRCASAPRAPVLLLPGPSTPPTRAARSPSDVPGREKTGPPPDDGRWSHGGGVRDHAGPDRRCLRDGAREPGLPR